MPLNYVPDRRNLVVLGCSSTKVQVPGDLPAISMYDGPMFRVLRSYLRDRRWPSSLSVAVLSAKHGLIGGLTPISYYDARMTSERALQLHSRVTEALSRLAVGHPRLELILGRSYLQSIDLEQFDYGGDVNVARGSIGLKLNRLHDVLHGLQSEPRVMVAPPDGTRPLYFLPDWDDFLDVKYDFKKDAFSATTRSQRNEQHSITLMRPARLADGVLVSLAQNLGSKGMLRRVGRLESDSLAPKSVRDHFSLRPDQWAFGDCGAFSYVNEDRPTITVPQAVSLYQLYDFDFGASVDHIPVQEIQTEKGTRKLSAQERGSRVRLTRENAQSFIDEHRHKKCRFVPIGVIQGASSEAYAKQVPEYAEMGYEYVALGGLVPRDDGDVLAIVEKAVAAARKMKRPPAIHLLGVFRPNLQERFRELRIASFDSATYFRKAWLRSSQNYLATDGTWFSAIRVPPSRDPRTLERLKDSGASETKIKRLEQSAMQALHRYDRGRMSLDDCLKAVVAYDALLSRSDSSEESVSSSYRHTLAAKPWQSCTCPMCSKLGIDVLIFRGLNRNKRRGAHNTLQLYNRVSRER